MREAGNNLLCIGIYSYDNITNGLFTILLHANRHQGVHSVTLSTCSLLLHTSGCPLAAEDGTRPPHCRIFQVLSVEVLTTEILDVLDSATGVAS